MCFFYMGGYYNIDKKISLFFFNFDIIMFFIFFLFKYILKKSYCEFLKSLDNMDVRIGRSDMTVVVIIAFELLEIC